MSEFKGTKGKLEADIDNISCNYNIISEGFYLGEGRIKEDAILMSKALEMLEMLERCREYIYVSGMDGIDRFEIMEDIKQLIKEATEL